jgi:hypothetical protein
MAKRTYKLWIHVEPHEDGEPVDDLNEPLGYIGEVKTIRQAQKIIDEIESMYGAIQ